MALFDRWRQPPEDRYDDEPEPTPEPEAIYSHEDAEELREALADARLREREAERLAYEVLSEWPEGLGPRELKAKDRRRYVKQAQEAWERDPQAGAAVDLMNDFSLGRGIPRPRAKNPKVQEVLDEAWDDPDNQLALTSYEAQYAFGTDLTLQSNVFFLAFDDGQDGQVKLGILNHNTVESAVRDPDNRLRVLYYMCRQYREEWDFEKDAPKKPDVTKKMEVRYHEHWRNVEVAKDLGTSFKKPPRGKIADGRVYHVAINRRTEQVFGVPTMRRVLRWFSAYNEFMSSRVDIAKAAAAFIMRRKVSGGPNKVMTLAQKVMNQRSELAAKLEEDDPQAGPRAASILTENEGVQHEPFNLNTNSSNALQDGQMIQGQVAAGSRFPRSYFGSDPSSLAGATAVELPVLKAVEARQEVIEGVFRWFFDLVIERAQAVGRLPTPQDEQQLASPFTGPLSRYQRYFSEAEEEDPEDDMSYEFSLPSPQRRMMGELVSATANVAKTFDPNGTNIELSRTLLAIALGQGLEVENPSDVVKRIFPEGYVDPVTQLLQQQQQGGGAPPGGPGPSPPAGPQGGGAPGFQAQQQQLPGLAGPGSTPSGQTQMPHNVGFPGANGQRHSEQNPYGAPRQAGFPTEARFADLPDSVKVKAYKRGRELEEELDDELAGVVELSLTQLETSLSTNGHNGSNGRH